MKMNLTSGVLLCLAVALVEARKYHHHRVISVTPLDKAAIDGIHKLSEKIELDFWLDRRMIGKSMHIRVAPEDYPNLLRGLAQLNVHKVSTLVNNLQELIEQERKEMSEGPKEPVMDVTGFFTMNQYHTYQEMQDWLQSLAKAYPDLVSVDSFGPTCEKRQISVAKIGKAKPGTTKPIYWLDAGIHAREWIAPATALYIINQLVSKYSSDSTTKQLLDNIDFYIVPSLNPDGYTFTERTDDSGDRLWRKTRCGPYCKSNWFGKKCCYGADPNRNWGFHWDEAGVSNDPCQITYAGPKAFSEANTLSASQYMSSLKNMKAYITLHSYSDLWMFSYAYARGTYTANHDEIVSSCPEQNCFVEERGKRICRKVQISGKAVQDIKGDYGTVYQYGTPADILYAASGASSDWVSATLNTEWVYALELRPGENTSNGFILPASQIIAGADEAWQGLRDVAMQLLK